MASAPEEFSPEAQQYLKKVKVNISYGEEGIRETYWVAENTTTQSTRRFEFLVERAAAALVPVMSAWLHGSKEEVGIVDTCDLCCGDDDDDVDDDDDDDNDDAID